MALQILEISRSDLGGLPTPDPTITGVKHLASYNWLEALVPTILVPGCPSLWFPPPVPPELTPDSGVAYIDQNAARNPHSPLEPLFRALYAQDPSFELQDIDLVTDRTNVRKLLRFVQGSSSDVFQIQVEVVGSKTALLTRVETKATEVIQGFKGYGRNFEKAYTKGRTGSTGHHRIISYRFGGMSCVVRYETDGYVDTNDESAAGSKEVEPTDNLPDALSTLSISSSSPAVGRLPTTVVRTGGKAVDPASILEIKTRASSRTLDMGDVLSQLWISQTPKLAVGYYRNGVFDNIKLRDMTQDILDWERTNEKDLCGLACLIGKIIGAARQNRDCRAVVTCDGAKIRVLGGGEQKRGLPNDLYSRLEGRPTDNSPALTQAGTDVPGRGEDARGVQSSHPSQNAAENLPYISDGAPYAEIIKHGMRDGFRQYFRRMPTEISAYRVLCESLKSSAIDVLGGRKIRDIMGNLRSGKSEWDPDEGREVEGLKSLARDSAFRLLYLFLMGEVGSGPIDKSAAYNAALFVVSHSTIFRFRTRRMVREAFEDAFAVSEKQRKGLDRWTTGDSASTSQEEDVTTEEEAWYHDSDSDWCYDSDWS